MGGLLKVVCRFQQCGDKKTSLCIIVNIYKKVLMTKIRNNALTVFIHINAPTDLNNALTDSNSMWR